MDYVYLSSITRAVRMHHHTYYIRRKLSTNISFVGALGTYQWPCSQTRHWFPTNNVVAVFTQVLKDKGLWPATIFGFSHIRFKLFSWQFETLANLSLYISTVCFRNITWVEHVLFRPFVRIKLTLLAFSITSHFRLLPMILHSVSAASDPWSFLMFSCFSAIILNCIETWALLSALRFARRGCCVPLLDDVCTTVCIAGVLSDTAWYITSWTVDALIFVCNWVVAMVNVCSTMAPVSNI